MRKIYSSLSFVSKKNKKHFTDFFKALVIIIALFVYNSAYCQQSLIQVNGWNAYVHLPSDYTTSKVYPTIIEFPGLGEVGTNASLVIEYGPGAYIAQGWNGDVGSVEFIVISLQPSAAYPAVNFVNIAVDSLKILYKIDPKNLFLTGYSEGGWCASMFVSSDPIVGPYTYASQVKAICTVEGVKPDDNADYPYGFIGFAKTGGKDLCLEQVNDGRDGGTVVKEMDSTVANSAYFYQTDIDGGGHCCWSSFYGGGGATPDTFPVFGTNETVYQWFASLVTTSTVPVISSATTATGTINTAFSYNIKASNSPTSYAAAGLPTGLSVNTSTGVISGTPTVSGTFSVTISATNVSGTGSVTLSITINPPAPVISSAAAASGLTGTQFSYTITASNSPTSYAATGLPSGLSINTSTGVINGTPTVIGTTSVTISATNVTGTGTKTLTITISLGSPVLSSTATTTGVTGTAFSYTITASNTPTSYAATPLPAGLSVSASTGVISGKPTKVGTTATTISATNAHGTGTETLTITINPPAPVISSAGTATGTTGTAFSYTIAASNTPTSYAATGLPSGLTVNTSTGIINGTPTVAGTFSVTISATNAGGSGTKTLSIVIAYGNITVYFENTTGWPQPNVYCWSPTPSTYASCTTWPGTAMAKASGCGDWWSYTFTGVSGTNLIFNDGGFNQTANLNLSASGIYNFSWSTQAWVTGAPVCTAVADSIVVYFDNTGNWTKPEVYCWSPTPSTYTNCSAWPGNSMTKINSCGNWWKYMFTGVTATNLIFDDGGSNQTSNLSLGSIGIYNFSWSTQAWVSGVPSCTISKPEIVSVAAEASEAKALAVPNPVINNNLQISMQSNIAGNATIKIIDLTGRLIQQENNFMINTGNNTIGVPLKKIAPGYYVAVIEQAGKTSHVKFMKN